MRYRPPDIIALYTGGVNELFGHCGDIVNCRRNHWSLCVPSSGQAPGPLTAIQRLNTGPQPYNLRELSQARSL